MSDRADATLWALSQRVGRGSDKLILAILASYTDAKHQAWPSQTTIAVAAELDVKTVGIGLRRLEASKFIKQVGTVGGGCRVWQLPITDPPPPETGEEVPDPVVKTEKEGGKGETQGTLIPDPPKPEPPPKPRKDRGDLTQIRDLCISLKLPQSDADWFYWKCEGNGWKNGGQPILDWRATVRAWERGKFFPSQRQNGAGNGAAESRRQEALTRSTQSPLTVRAVATYVASDNGHQTNGTINRIETAAQVPRAVQDGPG
jgi:hypothetical protein